MHKGGVDGKEGGEGGEREGKGEWELGAIENEKKKESFTFAWIAFWTDVDQCLSILSNDGLNVIRCLRRFTDRIALQA
jgi:hypothetical protein